jgi:hypothetical protein
VRALTTTNPRGRQIALWLKPETHEALAELCRIYGMSQREVIEMLIRGKSAEVRNVE